MKHFVTAMALGLAPFAATAQSVTIETFAGPVDFAQTPEKVVAMDIAAIDTLGALGIELAGVPAFGYPDFLQDETADVATVGTLFEPDFEALAVMAPDLIIAGGRSQTQVEPLSAVAPTIDMSISDDIIGVARDRVFAYGTLFGLEDEASEIVADLDASFEAARAAVEGRGEGLVILTNGGKISAYGSDSRFGWVHTSVGLPEAYADIEAETHGQSVSFEFIAEVNPDWILVIDRGAAIGQDGEAAKVTLDNPLVQNTTAGQNGQIVYLNSAAVYLSGGGVQAMTIIADQITQAFGASS